MVQQSPDPRNTAPVRVIGADALGLSSFPPEPRAVVRSSFDGVCTTTSVEMKRRVDVEPAEADPARTDASVEKQHAIGYVAEPMG